MLISLVLAGRYRALAQNLPNNFNQRYHLSERPKDTLNEIHISSKKPIRTSDARQHFTSGQQRLSFDSTLFRFYKLQNLADLIAEQSPVFVKSYGVNSMATLSIRGASSAQSEVMWEGVPISNATTGISDISLLQGGLFNDVSIQYGGSSALFGSGNVGGALLLNDKSPDFKPEKNMAVSLGTGSYGRADELMQMAWQNQNWHFGLKVFYEKAQNDFPYSDDAGDRVRMTNAALEARGGIFSADYLFRQKAGTKVKRQTLSAKVWWQQYNREIPPALFEAFSVKRQTNRSLYSLLNWQQKRKRSLLYAKFSFNNEYLLYQDGVVLPGNENQTHQWYAELGWNWQINNPFIAKHWLHELLLFMPLQGAVATGGNLVNDESRALSAIAAAYKLQTLNERFSLNWALRIEKWQQQQLNYLPGWNGNYRLFQSGGKTDHFNFNLLANVQKSYRVPTISELYFFPGGNPDLKPERGWNEDAGFRLQLNLKEKETGSKQFTWELSNQTSFFNRNIKDWIYWLGGAIWTPHNLAEVHSRGVETESKAIWKHRKTALSLSLKTAYVLATTTASYLPNDNSIGNQIPYTPRYRGIVNLGFSLKNFFINYNHQYTGYRFVTTDESQFLKPYQDGNLQASYTFPVKHTSFSVIGQVRNCWDSHYEIVSGRPVPGRNYLLSLRMTL